MKRIRIRKNGNVVLCDRMCRSTFKKKHIPWIWIIFDYEGDEVIGVFTDEREGCASYVATGGSPATQNESVITAGNTPV